jgi:hypothetical protein
MMLCRQVLQMLTRTELHTMLDSIPEDRLAAAQEALAALADPVLVALLSAPEDDEPLTDEDIRALDEAREDREHGRTISLDELVARGQAHT